MRLNPEQHHEDCDLRNSHAAKQAAEVTGVDAEKNSEVFDCSLGCEELFARSWEYAGNYVITHDGGSTLIELNPYMVNESDARLIAAAPDLLMIAKRLVAWDGEGSDAMRRFAIDAELAIEKAGA